MVNLGTGIGGGIVLGGRVIRGRFGIAGEFGHMQVVPDGIRCECGNKGCWEQYASGNALVREARELARAKSPVVHFLLQQAGGDPECITGPLVTAAAQAGDPASVELLSEMGHWLGVGIASLAAALDPGMFVIGGGVSKSWDKFGHLIKAETEMVPATLQNRAGIVGAALVAHRMAGIED